MIELGKEHAACGPRDWPAKAWADPPLFKFLHTTSKQGYGPRPVLPEHILL